MATEVILTVSDSIFSDPTGADVDASVHQFANILERKMENRYDEYLLDITVREASGSAGSDSIQIYPDDHLTDEQAEGLRLSIDHLMSEILSGNHGEWVVPAATTEE